MKAVSTGYEQAGRTRQKQRTRELLLTTARHLLATGDTPTVDSVAEASGISRTTAYRYFPSRTALLAAAHPEVQAVSLLTDPQDDDPARRLDDVVRRFLDIVVASEPQQRAMLRLSLSAQPGELPLRQGRAIGWIGEALEPLRDELGDAELRRLVLAVRATTGIEALVWLVDVAGLSRPEAVSLVRRSAAALLADARRGPPTAAGPGRGDAPAATE